MSNPASNSEQKVQGPGVTLWIIFFMMCAMLIYFALPLFLIIFFGMSPAVVAVMIDTDREHSLSSCVFLSNLCGVIPYTVELFKHGHSMHAAFAILYDPMTWLAMMTSAGIGWGFYLCIPQIVGIALRSQARIRISRLNRRLELLEEVWGALSTRAQNSLPKE